jgi:hypothetical protein
MTITKSATFATSIAFILCTLGAGPAAADGGDEYAGLYHYGYAPYDEGYYYYDDDYYYDDGYGDAYPYGYVPSHGYYNDRPVEFHISGPGFSFHFSN